MNTRKPFLQRREVPPHLLFPPPCSLAGPASRASSGFEVAALAVPSLDQVSTSARYEHFANDIFQKSFSRTRTFPHMYLYTSYPHNSYHKMFIQSKGLSMFQYILKAEQKKISILSYMVQFIFCN